MARIVMPGGTDVAEVAVFDVQALPESKRPESGTARSMEAGGTAMRFPTGADGGYLLHVYLDEPIPPQIMKYCVADDAKSAALSLESGRLGFGGAESMYSGFIPNRNIRCDAEVPPGTYLVKAYHTDYPDDLIDSVLERELGTRALRLLALPSVIGTFAVLATLISVILREWYVAGVIVLFAAIGISGVRRNPRVRQLRERKSVAELDYPSIVIEMRSNFVLQRGRWASSPSAGRY